MEKNNSVRKRSKSEANLSKEFLFRFRKRINKLGHSGLLGILFP